MPGSKIRVNEIVNLNNDGPVDFPLGVTQNGQAVGSGQGVTEYTQNRSFEVDTVGWTVGTNATFTRSTAFPLVGTASGILTNTIAAARVLLTGDINPPDTFYIEKGRPLAASMDYELVDTVDNGDYIYDIWNETDDESVPGTLVDLRPGFNSVYVTFIPIADKVYKHRIRESDTATSAVDGDTIKIDNVSCTPEMKALGSAGGWKTYTQADVTVTGTNSFVPNLVRLQPYKDPINDTWRLAFNINGDTAATSRTTAQVTIPGITFKNLTNGYQAVSFFSNAGGASPGAYASQNSNNLNAEFGTSAPNRLTFSGDVELEEKPTWADFDNTVDMLTASRVQENARVRYYMGSVQSPSANNAIAYNIQSTYLEKVGTWGNTVGEITVPVPGTYAIRCAGQAASFASAYNIYLAIAGSREIDLDTNLATDLAFACGVTVTITDPSSQTLSIRCDQNITTLSNTDRDSWIELVRISDRSADSGLGYGIATDGNPGLIPYYKSEVFSLVGVSSDFTSASQVTLTRIGNVVTVTSNNVTHGALAAPSTNSIGIPSEYHPDETVSARYLSDRGMVISTTGVLSFEYDSGARTSSGRAATISYIVT